MPLLSVFKEETQQWFRDKVAILEKILADEFEIKRDEKGHVIQISLLPEKKKGKYRIASAVDPDANFRVHGKKITFG